MRYRWWLAFAIQVGSDSSYNPSLKVGGLMDSRPLPARHSVFVSYSHRDREWLDRLNVHLRPMVRDRALVVWDDTKIAPGSKWKEEIKTALVAARVAFLLVSADFLASDFVVTNELPLLLTAARDDGAVILPLILSPSRFLHTPLAEFQALNDPSRPLIALTRAEQEEILVRATEAVERAMQSNSPQKTAAGRELDVAWSGTSIPVGRKKTIPRRPDVPSKVRPKRAQRSGRDDAVLELEKEERTEIPISLSSGEVLAPPVRPSPLQPERVSRSQTQSALPRQPEAVSGGTQAASPSGPTDSLATELPVEVQPPRGPRDKEVELRSLEQELRGLFGRSGPIESVAFSPDGRWLASGSQGGGSIGLWDAASGQEAHILKGHTDTVYSVAFCPDSRSLASGSRDGRIKLWDVASGREVPTGYMDNTLFGFVPSVLSVVFSPDGRWLASGSQDGTTTLWRVASEISERKVRTLTGHSAAASSVAFSPDGRRLASGSWDRTIKLWDVASGQEVCTLTGHTDYVRSVAFSPDGGQLASGSADRTIRLWDMASTKEPRTLRGHSGQNLSVAFSPDGCWLASSSGDTTIKLWDAASGRELHTLTGHTYRVTSVAFSPDGRWLASGSSDNTIKLWKLKI